MATLPQPVDTAQIEHPVFRPVRPHAQPRNRLARGLELWHLLSLDAPTVAMLWTQFIARANHITLPLTTILAMGLAVWILYAGDRLLDTRSLPTHAAAAGSRTPVQARGISIFGGAASSPIPGFEARHYFHRRHKNPFRIGLVFASVALALVFPKIVPPSVRLYLILGAVLFAYFLLIHVELFSNLMKSLRLPKELAVGVFFSAATFIPTISRNSGLRLALLPGAALFAAACSVNCLFIYAWEHPIASVHIEPETIIFQRVLPYLTAAVIATGLVLSLGNRTLPWPIPIACVSAVLSLLLLHRNREHFPPAMLRAAADLCLLTPLFLLHLK